jgi:glycosyltransferase involved in cell wall biosynthesis
MPAVGGVRPSKFAAYLPAHGWDPIVVAAAPARPAGGSGAAGVHYVSEWPHPLKSYERLRASLASRRGSADDYSAKLIVPFEQCHTIQRRTLKQRCLPLFWLPDREIGWLGPALWRGLRLIRGQGITHLLTTGPPFTCHLAGLLLKRMTHVRWVADFRDPWSLAHKFPIFRNGVTDALESRWIRAVMREADLVLCVTPAMTDEARKDHPDLPPERFATLTSGFDPAELAKIEWRRPAPLPVVMSYFGTFYHGRTPEPFLRAVRGLLDDGALARDEMAVRFVGQVSHADGRSITDMVRSLGLESLVTLHPPVPRIEALKRTLESHVVLVLDERHPVQIPLKLYDALGAGVTVLNIGSHGAVADVLARTGAGMAVHYQRDGEIRDGVLECLRRARSMPERSDRPWADPRIQEFDFQRLTGRLAGHLNDL